MGLSKLTIVDTKQSQNFTSSEKAQARANIGAVSYEDLSSVSPMTELTYADLVATRNGGKLVPGMNYKITDYTTSTSQQDTMAAGHDFCVIVQALDEHTLSENANACKKAASGDIEDMDSITLKALIVGDDYNGGGYEIDDDSEMYAYYDKYTIDGTEYHRWMKYSNRSGIWLPVNITNNPVYALTLTDTFDLSDGYVEFDGYLKIDQETGDIEDYEKQKNKVIMEVTEIEVPLILFENKFDPDEGYEDAPEVYDMGNIWVYNGTWDLDGTTYHKWIKYNDAVVEQGQGYDAFYMLTATKNYRNNSGKQEPDGFVYVDSGELENRDGNYRAEVILGTNYESAFYGRGVDGPYFDNCNIEAWELKYCLDNDTDRFAWADTTNGKGVIYYMKDEFNNECPYDFKNIMFLRKLSDGQFVEVGGIDTYVHTFAAFNEDNGTYVDATLLNNTNFGDAGCCCKNNIIKEYNFDYNEETYSLIRLNDIVFLNIYSIDNESYFMCYSNTFGTCCHNNTFGGDCVGNTCGNNFYYNTFGYGCSDNTFGNAFYYNTFGTDCRNNTFGSECYYNTFGNSFQCNTFGNDCYENTFGNIFCYNTFGNYFDSNTFGNGCYYNTFGSECGSNRFGNYFNSNTFGSACVGNIFGNNCRYNTFGNNCQLNRFASNSGGTTAGDYFYNNILENGVSYCILYNTSTASSSNLVKNYNIKSSVVGTRSSNKLVEATRKLAYDTTVALNSSGELKIYCEADLIA